MKNTYSHRKYVIYIILGITGAVFIFRLLYIQVINDKYKLSASNNVLRYVTDYPARGLIYDRNGKLLVYNEATYDLMVIPRNIKNIDTTELCNLIDISKKIFIKKIKKICKYSMYKPSVFEKQISKESSGYLQEKLYKFHGFYVQTRALRKYPLPVAAHTLGYISEVNQNIIEKDKYYKSGDYIGKSGIEKTYEKILRGQKGVKIKLVDVFNREKGSFQDGKYDTASIAGKNLYISIDAELQAYGELLMKNKKGSIVAIEPSTGEILALVSSPSYNPNLLVGRIRSKNYENLAHDKLKPLFNRALMAQYPPGSTFKPVEALVGQQMGVLSPETKYECHGGFHAGSITVHCHNHRSPLDLKEAIQYSCNTYFCKVFKAIINNSNFKTTQNAFNIWRKNILSFGLGKKFNNDLAYELSGNIPTAKYYDKYYGKNRWSYLTIISLSIGQGEIELTPLQLANVSAIIANRGYYYTPHILKDIGNKYNINKKYKEKHFTSIDTKYFDIVVEGMYLVVEAGTGRWIKMDSLSICGKTGTAQNPHGKDHSVFMAFAPKDNPKIALAVFVENGGYGSTIAAPITSLMIEKYISGKISKRSKYRELNMLNMSLQKIYDQQTQKPLEEIASRTE
jgi:penicillin-binding protein 2